MIRKPPALKPIVEALADFKVLKVWIVPLESLMVYLYLIDMVLFSLIVFKQGAGLPPDWFLFLALVILAHHKIMAHIAMP